MGQLRTQHFKARTTWNATRSQVQVQGKGPLIHSRPGHAQLPRPPPILMEKPRMFSRLDAHRQFCSFRSPAGRMRGMGRAGSEQAKHKTAT